MRTLLVYLAAGLAASVVACGAPPAALRVDVQAYVERSRSWAPIEAETAQTLDRILQTQFVDEAEVLRQIAESRPRIVSHLDAARVFEARSEPVRDIHRRYIQTWELLLRGYEATERGFSSGDFSQLARGREAIAAWRDGIVTVAQELREIMKRVGADAGGSPEATARL